jgi:periplasmic divalent cation tolerance protein
MADSAPTARIVLTTTGTAEEAERLARTLVDERLAACATLIPGAVSIYRWQGEVESASETMLLIKTSIELLATLESRLNELHSYEAPEFLVLPVESGSNTYLNWLKANLRGV